MSFRLFKRFAYTNVNISHTTHITITKHEQIIQKLVVELNKVQYDLNKIVRMVQRDYVINEELRDFTNNIKYSKQFCPKEYIQSVTNNL